MKNHGFSRFRKDSRRLERLGARLTSVRRGACMGTRTIAEKWGHVPTLHSETQNPTRMDKSLHLDIFAPCPLSFPKPKTQQSGHVTPFFCNCTRASMLRVIPVYQKLGHGHLSNFKSKVTKYTLYVAIDVHYGDFSLGGPPTQPACDP